MLMSLIYCIGFIYLMSWFAEYIAWAIVITIQLGLIGGAVFFFGQYFTQKNSIEVAGQQPEMLLAYGIGFALFACILLICVYCGFNSLRVAINVIDASADFLAKTKRLIGVPVFYFLI